MKCCSFRLFFRFSLRLLYVCIYNINVCSVLSVQCCADSPVYSTVVHSPPSETDQSQLPLVLSKMIYKDALPVLHNACFKGTLLMFRTKANKNSLANKFQLAEPQATPIVVQWGPRSIQEHCAEHSLIQGILTCWLMISSLVYRAI